jgi:hypothetical protein
MGSMNFDNCTPLRLLIYLGFSDAQQANDSLAILGYLGYNVAREEI